VARGLLEAYHLPSEELPDRLRELVQLLLQWDALGLKEGDLSQGSAAEPTKLVLVVEDDPGVRDLAVALL